MASQRKRKPSRPSSTVKAQPPAPPKLPAAPKRPSTPKRQIALPLLSLNARFPLLVLSAWLIVYITRPFRLGIYHDDWYCLIEPVHATLPFSLSRLHWFVGIGTSYGPRPMLGFTAFVVSSLAGTSAFRLQLASILLVLAAALSLRSWLKRLLEPSPYVTFAADVAVIFWMVMPWMLGVTAWPTVAHTLVAQIFFTQAASLLLKANPLKPAVMLQFGALLLASYLTYEAFYFTLFVVLAYYVMFRVGPAWNKRSVAAVLLISGAAQAAAIAYNRYSAGRGGPSKSFSKQWILGFLSNVHSLPSVLAKSVGRPAVWRYLLLSFAACSLVLLIASLVQKRARPLSGRILGLLALAVATFLLSSAVYALAGYGFAPFGMESRTLFAASWSFTVAFFALLACLAVPSLRPVRAALLLSGAAVISFLAIAQRDQVRDWATVWQQEQRVLAAAPVNEIHQLPAESAILFIGPASYKSITVFNANWGLTPAVFSLPPLNQGRQPFQGFTQLYPVGEYVWTWDGTTLVMDLPGYWTQKFPARHLYLWNAEGPHLSAVAPGFKWPAAK